MNFVRNWCRECICILFSVGNVAAHRRRQHAVTVGKERRESLVRAKRLCRIGIGDDVAVDNEMIMDEELSILEVQTSSAVDELKSAVQYQYVDPFFSFILRLSCKIILLMFFHIWKSYLGHLSCHVYLNYPVGRITVAWRIWEIWGAINCYFSAYPLDAVGFI